MEIDLEPIRKKYQDVEWSLEMAGETPVRCLIGRKGKHYKAFVVPPHQYFTLKGKNWPKTAANEIARILREAQ